MSRTLLASASRGPLWIGAHVSGAGGVENALDHAHAIQARAVAFFTRNQRTWNAKPLTAHTISSFRQRMKDYNLEPDQIVPHGSYLFNCGSAKDELWVKSRQGLLDEVQRCEALGLTRYNFHPGSNTPIPGITSTREECMTRIATAINFVLARTSTVTICIENMSKQGSTIGGTFEELGIILNQIHDPDRIGVCLDTCHAFAAGYDLSTEAGYEATMAEFERHVGFQYLKAVHLNDSKTPCGSHKDKHEKIGRGHMGIQAFRRIVNDAQFYHLPMILETPCVNKQDPLAEYQQEIQLVYSLVDEDRVNAHD